MGAPAGSLITPLRPNAKLDLLARVGTSWPASYVGKEESRATMADFDLAIIGGGINGAGIARDAAGRGLSVLLIEQNDLASGTSSKSTKLIHGGLRYLEFYAFRLVREALIEREVLIRIAPHLTRPLRFVLPHHSGPAARLDAPSRPVHLRPSSADATSCPAPRWSISRTIRSASR